MIIFDQLGKNDRQLRLLAQIVFGGMLVLLLGLWWVQIVSYRNFQAHQETQSFRTVRVPAVRGKILDRNGVVLADSRPDFTVSLYLEELRDAFQETYKQMRPMKTVTNSVVFWKRWLGVSPVQKRNVKLTSDQIDELGWQVREEVVGKIVRQVGAELKTPLVFDPTDFKQHYLRRLALPYPILDSLNPTQIARFEEQPEKPVGVELDAQSIRFYPQQTLAAHLLGHLQSDDIAKSSKEGEDATFDYRLPDFRGVLGVEYAQDKALRGKAGAKSVLVNNLGYRQTESYWSPVEPGSNVVLTIDATIQRAAEEALASAPVTYPPPVRGAAVVMDVETGDILAMASSPVFNPNEWVTGFPPGEYQKMQSLTAEKNRATQENYAPGSIFKTIIGLACLEAGMDPNATIDNPGYIYLTKTYKIGDLAQPGIYDFRRAISESSNTYFITNGIRYAGIENIVKLGMRLHLGERIGLNNRQETPGTFPTLKQVRSHWPLGDTAQICIGQGYIAVTPLQMTIMAASLANGGKVLYPRFVDRIEPADVSDNEQANVFPKARVRDNLGISQRSLNILRDAMRSEVEEGTGRAAAIPGFPICGKTGTAEIKDEHGRQTGKTTWFLSFAPAQKPRYAVVVMVENGSFGGPTCAPAAKKIYEAILANEKGRTPQIVAAK